MVPWNQSHIRQGDDKPQNTGFWYLDVVESGDYEAPYGGEYTWPATEDKLGEIPETTEAEMDEAIASANKAQAEWNERSPLDRSHVLHEVASLTQNIVLIHRGKVIADGDVSEIRGLMDEHPHRIVFRCQGQRRLAEHLVAEPNVRGVEVQEVDGEKPREAVWAEAFRRAGFRAGYRGFEAELPR